MRAPSNEEQVYVPKWGLVWMLTCLNFLETLQPYVILRDPPCAPLRDPLLAYVLSIHWVFQYRVLKNLQGQRLGAKAWYTCLTNFLVEKGFTFHTENPCLGKLREEDGSVFVLIHVDDLMFYGDVPEVEKFIQVPKSKFEISISQMKDVGEEFQFLKRTYRLESDGLAVKPGRYSDDMIEYYERACGPVKVQKLPAGPEIKDTDVSDLLGVEHASLFRSLVGSGIYLAQERLDIACTIKELAASMSNPTASSMAKMKRLIGYLKETKDQYMHLPYPVRGQGIVIRLSGFWTRSQAQIGAVAEDTAVRRQLEFMQSMG